LCRLCLNCTNTRAINNVRSNGVDWLLTDCMI
jgi:hypothetical protein